MKRFLLFADRGLYDHCGGWNEFIDSFSTLDAAQAYFAAWVENEAGASPEECWGQIVDTADPQGIIHNWYEDLIWRIDD